MNRLLEALEQHEIVIADGGMGTLVQQEAHNRGFAPAIPPGRVMLEDPGLIESIQAAYASSGAEILLTNTFACSPFQLRKQGIEDRFDEIHRLAARIARRAAGPDRIVMGDLGPLGEFFAPMGTLSESAAVDAYASRARAVYEAGEIDAFLVETQFDLTEVRCAVEGIRSVTDLPIVTSLSFDSHGHTMMGVSPEDFADSMAHLGIDILGANCGAKIDDTLHAIEAISRVTPHARLWAKPNAGVPTLVDGKEHYPLDPTAFAAESVRFRDAGVRVFGGCCGTTPAHIAALASVLGAGR
jgi:5-methyltetrahydrofolate--homocysteine methyltransferase